MMITLFIPSISSVWKKKEVNDVLLHHEDDVTRWRYYVKLMNNKLQKET